MSENNASKEEKTYCSYHPEVETNLTCSNCGKPICPRDMVYTSVGLKCPECGRPTRRMRGGPRPIYYVRAVASGSAAALVAGVVALEIRRQIGLGGFFVALAIGYAVGEAVSRAVYGRLEAVFQVVAGVAALLAALIAGYFGDPVILWRLGAPPALSPQGVLYAALAVIIAVARVRS